MNGSNLPEHDEARAADPSENDNGRGEDGSPIDRVTRERDEYLDQLQRSRAEFANFQKRIRAQAESDRAYAVGNLANDLLGALDNFELALDAARKAGNESIIEGLALVKKQVLDALAKHGVEPINALGRPFDPNLHEAISQRPDAHHPEGTVVGELARGYMLRDRVLRPSRVAVSVAPSN